MGVEPASRPKPAGDGRRSLESLVESLSREDAAKLARVWPLYNEPAGAYDERLYQESLRAKVVTTLVVCRRQDLLRCSDGEFVAAAFRVIAGQEPDRSVWQYHVNRLRSGEVSRDDILASLQEEPAARDRNVVIFDGRHLRSLVEFTGAGLREVAQVLIGLTRPRARRRFGLLVGRLQQLRRR